MKKFPKIKYPNDPETDGLMNGEVVVTEKLDGANFRFRWDSDGTLHVGTRNCVYRDAANNENLPKAFEHAVEYVDEHSTYDPDEWEWGLSGLTLFGEAMHLHSLEYEGIDWENPSSGSPHVPLDSEQPNVVLFDAWIGDDGWVHWDTVEDISHAINIPHTPIIERGRPNDLSFEVPDESMFGGPPEGIVARRVDGSVRAKKVTEDFKETNATAFNDPSKAQSDAAEFVAAYVTPQRVEKTAHKLVDEDAYETLEMPMMEDLPRAVLVDVMSEHGWDLLTSGGFEADWDDDFKAEVRSKASTKCARVLKQELQSF